MEKTDDILGIYHNKCNKHDACKDSLLKEKPNTYNKHNTKYQEATIFEERRKRPRVCGQLGIHNYMDMEYILGYCVLDLIHYFH